MNVPVRRFAITSHLAVFGWLAGACLLSMQAGPAQAKPQAAPVTSCENLRSLNLPYTTIDLAQTVAAGAFTPPAAPARGGAGGGAAAAAGRGARGPQFADLPAFCRIQATVRPTSDSEIKIEVWMPATGWNGKLRGTGNGGLGGGAGVGVGALASGLRGGFATVGSNTGHEGDASYALDHPEKIIDFGYRSAHEMTVKAKALITAYYGTGPKYSYMAEGGGGSISAMSEAQRYPEDCDAIASGGFGADLSHHTIGQLWMWYAAHNPDGSYILPPEKYPVLHQAALDACDTLDGLKDGIISNVVGCHFDPKVIECKGADGPMCLTAAQVEAARKIYQGPVNPRTHEQIFSGMYPGSELGWGALAGPMPIGIATDWFKYFVYKDPNWDYRTKPINYDRDVARSDAPANLPADAMDPDLSKFAARGGKLLLYNGWSDNLIPTGVAIAYYRSVVAKMGAKNVSGFMRFFMVPDMGHGIGTNGASAYNFDPLNLIEQWKEDGKAPDTLIVDHYVNGEKKEPRLVCPFPQYAQYKGSGSPDDPANFVCKAPK